MLPQFNPFGCSLEEMTGNDLQKLLTVAEGWYIEYKGTTVPAKSIAKSLSAFANHYGGWIFYGVNGSRNGGNLADSFPGIDRVEALKFIEQIRDAARNSLNPAPYYEYKILDGPCDEIHLDEGRSIVVVAVPMGVDAPYIHGDGRIYRRVADASDPKAEIDRFVLDQLWQRRQKAQDNLRLFLQQEQYVSEYQAGTSFIQLFLLHDPLGIQGRNPDIRYEQFRDFLLKDNSSPELTVAFQNFYAMGGGYIARANKDNDPHGMMLTWQYYFNGSSIITIPLSSYTIRDYNTYPRNNDYKYIQQFIRIARKEYYDFICIDVNQLFFVITSLVSQYKRIIEIGGIKGDIYAKISLHNAWKRIPFFDTEDYIEHIRKYGFPVIYFTQEYSPHGLDFHSLLVIEQQSNDADENYTPEKAITRQIELAIPVLLNVAGLVGIPDDIYVKDWTGAMFRAIYGKDDNSEIS